MNVGDTICTLGDVQYIREIPCVNWGEYHEYIGGCSVHQRGYHDAFGGVT